MTVTLNTPALALSDLPSSTPILSALRALCGARFAAIAVRDGEQWRVVASQDEIPLHLSPGSILDRLRAECDAIGDRLDAVHNSGKAEVHNGAGRQGASEESWHFIGYPIKAAGGTIQGVLFVSDNQQPLSEPAGLRNAMLAFADALAADFARFSPAQRATGDLSESGNSDANAPGASAPGINALGENSADRPSAWAESSQDDGRRLHPSPASARVLGVMGHDLRNPLHSLLAAIEMLKSKPLDPRAQRLLGMVEGSANRLGELAQANLDFARHQIVGTLGLQPEPSTDLAQRLQKVIDGVVAAYPQREFQVELTSCERVMCDSARLAQAFSAVLVHAIRHAATEGALGIRSYRDPEDAFVLVINVPGYIVAPELVEHLFDPFYYADGEAKTAQYGVGLYLAQGVAMGHGGGVEVAQDAGGDAAFTFRIPQGSSE